MECIINLFADDTLGQQRINNVASFEIVNRDIQGLTSFNVQLLVKLNATKTDEKKKLPKSSKFNLKRGNHKGVTKSYPPWNNY